LLEEKRSIPTFDDDTDPDHVRITLVLPLDMISWLNDVEEFEGLGSKSFVVWEILRNVVDNPNNDWNKSLAKYYKCNILTQENRAYVKNYMKSLMGKLLPSTYTDAINSLLDRCRKKLDLRGSIDER